MPELVLPCGDELLTCTAVSVQKYRRYTEIMERNGGQQAAEAYEANRQIVAEFFGVTSRKLDLAQPPDIMAAAKQIHFIAQEVIAQKFLDLNPEHPERVEKEASIFDEYDRENGYDDEEEDEAAIWKIMRENVDRVVKMCIRVLKQSYSECMQSDIMSLLDYVAFEIRTVNEK